MKRKKLFTVLLCSTLLCLAFSLYQLALSGSGGYTFKCYGSDCQYCGCVGDHAIVVGPCCGSCDDDISGGYLRCCGMYCPNY